MAKALTLERFSNFETATVRDTQLLEAALHTLEAQVDHSLFPPASAGPSPLASSTPPWPMRLCDQLAKTCLLNSTSTFWT